MAERIASRRNLWTDNEVEQHAGFCGAGDCGTPAAPAPGVANTGGGITGGKGAMAPPPMSGDDAAPPSCDVSAAGDDAGGPDSGDADPRRGASGGGPDAGGGGETAAPTRDRARPHRRLTPTPGAPLVAAPAGQTPTGTRRTMEQPAEQTAGAIRP